MAARRWTPEQRAQQAEAIRRWAPWLKSTGPRSTFGKAITSQNAMDLGLHSRVHLIFNAIMRRHARWCTRIRALARSDFSRNELLALFNAPVVPCSRAEEVFRVKLPPQSMLGW